MPRKPNYRFERSERDRQKAAKKAERLQAKADRAAARRDTPENSESGQDSAPAPDEGRTDGNE